MVGASIFLAIGLLVIFTGAAAYGFCQAMAQAGRRPAPYPRRWEEDPRWKKRR